MARQQRRRELGDLALHLGLVVEQPLHACRFEHVRRRLDIAAGEHLADELGARLGIRTLRAGLSQLRVDLGELLVVEHGVVLAREQACLGAEPLQLGVRLLGCLAQVIDLAPEPARGLGVLAQLSGRVELDIGAGDRIGRLGGELGGLRHGVDADHLRFRHGRDREALDEGVENAVVLGHLIAVARQAEHVDERGDQTAAAQRSVVLRVLGELQVLRHAQQDVARRDDLGLARHRHLVDAVRVGQLLALFLGPRVARLGALDQHLGGGLVARRDHGHHHVADQPRQKHRKHELAFAAADGAPQHRDVDVVGIGGGLRAVHDRALARTNGRNPDNGTLSG